MAFLSELTRALYRVLLESVEARIGVIVTQTWTPELSRELEWLDAYSDEIWDEIQHAD